MKYRLNNVRLGFANGIFSKQSVGDGEPKYGCQAIIDPKSTKLIAELKDVIAQVAKEKWKDASADVLAKLYDDDRVCFHTKPYKNKSGQVYPGFEGMYRLASNADNRPLTINKDKTSVTAEDGVIYSGCYGNVQVDIYAQDNKWGRRINATLTGVQFNGPGDAFTGSAPAQPDDFDDLADQGDDGGDLA